MVFRAVPTVLLALSIALAAVWMDRQSWTPDLPDTPGAGALYGALAGFSGVFLGFYFTALGFVVESVYPSASRALRSLIVRGRTEAAYVWYVVFLGVLSVVLLAIEAGGIPTGVAAIGVTAFGGAAALVGAQGLITGGLRYFDTGVLASEARLAFQRSYAMVDDADPSGAMSAWARDASAPMVRAVQELSTSADAVVGHEALSLLRNYWMNKSTRTWSSGWWSVAVVRPDWFTIDSTRLGSALSTETQLPEESEPDLLWVERPAVAAVRSTLSGLLASGDWLGATQLLRQASMTLRVAGLSLLADEAALLFDAITDELLSAWETGEVEDGPPGGARVVDVWDAHGACAVQTVIGIRLGWEHLASGLTRSLERIPTDRPGEAESMRLPLRLKKSVGELGSRLRFEAIVEGSTPTPRWFWVDFLAPSVLWELRDQLDRVEDLVDRLQGDVRPALANARDSLASAASARRCVELRKQFGLLVDGFREADGTIRSLVVSEDFELPDLPLTRAARFASTERHEDVRWAQVTLRGLMQQIGDPAAEELIGHTYSLVAQRCMEALLQSDAKAFGEMFRALFWTAIALEGRIPFRSLRGNLGGRLRLGVQPALDVMALSGYALLRDEVSGPGYWETVRREWDDHWSLATDIRERIRLLLDLSNGASLTFTAPRMMIRSQWNQAMTAALRAEGVSFDALYEGSPFYDGPPPGPARPLLRAATRGMMGIEDGEHVFAGAYLAARPEAAGLVEASSQVGSFILTWERARQRG